jgi:serine/threonine protein kinase
MAILRSSHKAGQTKPQDKPFNELISRLGQRSQLAAPKYADSTKRVNAQVWGRWTKYVYPLMHRLRLSSWVEANKDLPDSVRKSMTSPTISALLIPSKSARIIYTDAFRLRIARWIIEAVQLIHARGIIHSDLCLRKFLVYEDGLARLSDFATSGYKGHDALGAENASHYMPRDPEQPNSVESDLFTLRNTFYELITGKPPYHDKSDVEIESLYKQEEFPCIEDILCDELILRCWRREFKSADEMLAAFNDYVPLRREHLSKNQPLSSISS